MVANFPRNRISVSCIAPISLFSEIFRLEEKARHNYSQLWRNVITGSRNLAGNRNDSYDDLDFLYDFRARPDEEHDDDWVMARRRFKERAAAAFEEDLAEIRRKRRDMEVVYFDENPNKSGVKYRQN